MSADPEDEVGGGSEEAVRVFVRIRPLNKRELAEKQTIGWNFNDTSMLQDTQNGQRVYAFDRCFHPDGNNTEVYDIVGKPVVLKALEGFNGTVFTYGQTGSGKTFTMRGNDADPGMMILCIRDIFDYIAGCSKRSFELRVSYMEVYNEEINDLLGTGPNSKNLRIVSEDSVKGAVIGGLTEELVKNPAELLEVLSRGERSRSYGSTEMNAESSRSHTIYRLAITSKEVDDGTDGDIDAGGAFYTPSSGASSAGRLSFMNLVDLAGSERQKSTGASGKTLKEGSNINKSLLSLGAVISKLGEASKKPAKGAKPIFIPYRDSKLTRILKQSLGGNTLTSILCTVTPAPMHIEETVSTLKFGQLCKTIKNNVKNNEVVDDRALLKMYKNMVAELRAQLVEAESRGRTASLLSTGGHSMEDNVDGEEEGIGSRELRVENNRLKKELEDLKGTVYTLQQGVKEVQELEALKISLDDYQRESQVYIEEERAKMEYEKEELQKQRALMLAEKTQLNEKEGRLGTLLGMLDERESKLRQHLSALQEQQSQWQQSSDALRQREKQVEEWNRNHTARQNEIDEANSKLFRRCEELDARDILISEIEVQLAGVKKELADRDHALTAQKSRLAEIDIACTALQEKLLTEQAAINGRVAYLDLKEKEYAEKLKEQEIMDSLLLEREKSLQRDRKLLDEKLDAARNTEEQHRAREVELDKKANTTRIKEAEVVLMAERHARLLSDLEARESQYAADRNGLTENERALNEQEARLLELQDQLSIKEIRLAAVEEREHELNSRIEAHAKVEEDFYNVKVAMISARHSAELAELEALIAEQLKISGNFQEEIDKMRNELKDALREKSALEAMNNARGLLVEKLQLDISTLNQERRHIAAAELQHVDIGFVTSNAHGQSAGSSHKTDGGDDERSGSVPGLAPDSENTQFFLNQLGATQRMLFKILESHKQEKNNKEVTRTTRTINSRSKSLANISPVADGDSPRRNRHLSSLETAIPPGVSLTAVGVLRDKPHTQESEHRDSDREKQPNHFKNNSFERKDKKEYSDIFNTNKQGNNYHSPSSTESALFDSDDQQVSTSKGNISKIIETDDLPQSGVSDPAVSAAKGGGVLSAPPKKSSLQPAPRVDPSSDGRGRGPRRKYPNDQPSSILAKSSNTELQSSVLVKSQPSPESESMQNPMAVYRSPEHNAPQEESRDRSPRYYNTTYFDSDYRESAPQSTKRSDFPGKNFGRFDTGGYDALTYGSATDNNTQAIPRGLAPRDPLNVANQTPPSSSRTRDEEHGSLGPILFGKTIQGSSSSSTRSPSQSKNSFNGHIRAGRTPNSMPSTHRGSISNNASPSTSVGVPVASVTLSLQRNRSHQGKS